jgi:iron complex outermembrane receptor protein
VKHFERDGLVDDAGNPAPYDWKGTRMGARLDWEPTPTDLLTFSAEVFASENNEINTSTQLTPPFATTTKIETRNRMGNISGRWTRTFSPTSQVSVQTYYARTDHPNGPHGIEDEMFDFEFQHRFAPLAGHDVVWGVGHRERHDHLTSVGNTRFTPPSLTQRLYTAFVQDEITLVPNRLRLVLGSKVEHNDYTGAEFHPGVRALWTPAARSTWWSAVSRAVRAPDRFENTGRADVSVFQPGPTSPPIMVSVLGDPNIKSENSIAYEVGHRFEPTRSLAFDLASYYTVYRDVIDSVAGPTRFEAQPLPAHLLMPLTFTNIPGGYSYGGEAAVQWYVMPGLRVAADYTWLRIRFLDGAREFDSPEHQVRLRAFATLPHNWEITGALHRSSRLRTHNIPASLRFDLGLGWRPYPGLEFGLWGQNLLDPQHPEAVSFMSAFRGQVARTFVGRITWEF